MIIESIAHHGESHRVSAHNLSIEDWAEKREQSFKKNFFEDMIMKLPKPNYCCAFLKCVMTTPDSIKNEWILEMIEK